MDHSFTPGGYVSGLGISPLRKYQADGGPYIGNYGSSE